MRLKNLDLILTMAVITLNVIWALLPSHLTFIGIILALPLVFLLPGYTLTEAMFHKRSLDTSHRLILSLGLSLAIDILSGFILNMLPAGLQAITWTIFLGLVTATFSLLAAYFRRGVQRNRTQAPRFRISLYECILFGLALIITILSIQYSVISVAQQPHAGFTQLWMIQSNQANNSCAVRLGLRSFESTTEAYRITLKMNGTPVNTWSSLVLAPQQEWEQFVSIKPGIADNIYIEAQLYLGDKPNTVYRNVHLTFHGMKGGKNGGMPQCGTS